MWGQAQQMLSVRFMRHVIVGSFEHAHPAVSARLNSAAAAVRDVPGNKSGLITRNDSADTKHKISYHICMCVCVCVCVCVSATYIAVDEIGVGHMPPACRPDARPDARPGL